MRHCWLPSVMPPRTPLYMWRPAGAQAQAGLLPRPSGHVGVRLCSTLCALINNDNNNNINNNNDIVLLDDFYNNDIVLLDDYYYYDNNMLVCARLQVLGHQHPLISRLQAGHAGRWEPGPVHRCMAALLGVQHMLPRCPPAAGAGHAGRRQPGDLQRVGPGHMAHQHMEPRRRWVALTAAAAATS